MHSEKLSPTGKCTKCGSMTWLRVWSAGTARVLFKKCLDCSVCESIQVVSDRHMSTLIDALAQHTDNMPDHIGRRVPFSASIAGVAALTVEH
jgi:hypothetical protein